MPNSPVPSSYTKNFLPSKRILIVAGTLIVAGLAYWLVPLAIEYYQVNRARFSLSSRPPEPLVASGAPAPTLDKDTDGDGIPDWQEAIFGLDPSKADTDGDGVNDFLPSVNGVTIGDALKISDTSKLTLSVYGAFQNTPSNEIDPSQVETVAGQEVLNHAQAVEDSFKRYSKIDLTLGESSSKDIVAYSKATLALTETIGTDPVLFAKDIQEKILKGEDATKQISILNDGRGKLLAMTVPSKMADLHLSLVNGIYFLSQTLQIPQTDDELNTYTKSLIAQKNINLLSQTLFDISILQGVYATDTQ